MDKAYNHKGVEEKIYKHWEEKGYFKPEIHPKGKPYCIILPPPNANGALHFGHAMFTVEDILIRYHRMKGYAALWLPGTDHAGIETQYVFEKQLAKEGKSRFDYTQEELYRMIWDYVEGHRGGIQNQLRKLGFSLDWSRETYTLDPRITKLVCKTFKKMYDERIIYRDFRLVNYCTKDGTSFSDLEVKQVEQKDPLYYLKYGPFVLATVRPETKFGDTAVAVHPDDKRYKKWIGKEIEVEGLLGKFKLKVIADDVIDPNFGTGVAKVTPSIDMKDFEIGKRHNLPMKLIVDFDGKLTSIAGPYAGMYIKQARKKVVEDMQKKGLIEKIDENYTHAIATCYKCGMTLEPLPKEQWFMKVRSLADQATEAVRKGKIKIYPKTFESWYMQWLKNLRDWNISRQIIWGIRIPAWKNTKTGQWIVTEGEVPEGNEWEQDTDTFDTWFSSGQWPFATLRASPYKGDFEKFYPTDVMETAYDILKAWVSRMVMLGLYTTKKEPFRDVLFHGIVNDPYGKKMSKSKGNVVNPLELIEAYGADSVRFALVFGNATGNDQVLSYPKLDAARKFANKLWNIARFIEMKQVHSSQFMVHSSMGELKKNVQNEKDEEMIEKTEKVVIEITKHLDNYQFNLAVERLYEFIWHEFADNYIEDVKSRINENSYLILNTLYIILLKLLHPFMPFITEEIYQKLPGHGESLMIESWPL